MEVIEVQLRMPQRYKKDFSFELFLTAVPRSLWIGWLKLALCSGTVIHALRRENRITVKALEFEVQGSRGRR